MLEGLKSIVKGWMAILAIALLTMVVTKFLTELYDFRLIIAAAGGAFGYRPLVELFGKIKKLS